MTVHPHTYPTYFTRYAAIPPPLYRTPPTRTFLRRVPSRWRRARPRRRSRLPPRNPPRARSRGDTRGARALGERLEPRRYSRREFSEALQSARERALQHRARLRRQRPAQLEQRALGSLGARGRDRAAGERVERRGVVRVRVRVVERPGRPEGRRGRFFFPASEAPRSRVISVAEDDQDALPRADHLAHGAIEPRRHGTARVRRVRVRVRGWPHERSLQLRLDRRGEVARSLSRPGRRRGGSPGG